MSQMPSTIWAPKGETGDQGPPGNQGPQGNQGPVGPQGPAGTGVPQLIADLANQTDPLKGDKLVGHYDPVAPAFLKTTSDMLNGLEVSVFRFLTPSVWAAVRAFSGVMDAQPGIQLAIDAMNANPGGGSFHLPWGLYTVWDIVTVKSKVRIRGEGRSSVVRGEFASAKNRIFTTPHTVLQEDITLENFVIDRRGLNAQHGALFGGVRNFTFKDMAIIGPINPIIACGAVGFSPFDTFAQIQSENVQVINLYLEVSNNFGVAFGNVNQGSIIGTRTKNCFREVIGLEAWGDGTVSGGNPLGTHGIVEGIGLGNNVLNCSQNPIYHFGGSTGPVMLIGGSTSGGTVRDIQASGTVISVSEHIAGTGYDGLAMVGSPVRPLENVNVDGLIIYNPTRHGVSVGAIGQVTRDCSLSDVKVYNPNTGVSSSGSGVRVGNATGIDADNIRVKGTLHVYGVEEASGSNNNNFTDLLLDAGTSGTVNLVGANSKYSLKNVNQGRGGQVITESAGVNDDAVFTFSARGLNGRALYRIRGNFGLNDYAEFTVSSGAITAIYLGTDARIGAINPDVDGALNIYLTGNLVTIKNRLNSPRSFVLESVAP